MQKVKTYTVSSFNLNLKNYLQDNPDFKNFFIKGELSNVTYYKSGHLYFNLKDSKSQLKCCAFSYKYKQISSDLKDGDSVKIFGDIGLYEARGEMQILVRHIEKQDEIGLMFARLEKLKKEMAEKGYFDEKYKKPLPKYPKNIGVVTALTGAAVQDIIKTCQKRDDTINIYVYPAKVQGVGAKEEIVKGIEVLNKIPEIDLIIAGRGGGSIEDLWAFNEEEVALAFFNSKKPIISAVGHEVDFLLSDLVADFRAATPTQAIELSIPEKIKSIEELAQRKRYLNRLLIDVLKRKKEILSKRYENYFIKNFKLIVEEKNNHLILREEKLNKLIKDFIYQKENNLKLRVNRLIGLNPLEVLTRGYAVVTKDGKIMSKNKLKKDDEINILFNDGEILATVKEV